MDMGMVYVAAHIIQELIDLYIAGLEPASYIQIDIYCLYLHTGDIRHTCNIGTHITGSEAYTYNFTLVAGLCPVRASTHPVLQWLQREDVWVVTVDHRETTKIP